MPEESELETAYDEGYALGEDDLTTGANILDTMPELTPTDIMRKEGYKHAVAGITLRCW